MTTLGAALEARNWDIAALCLLLGLHAVLSRLPADSVEGLLDVLEGRDNDAKKG